MMRCGGTAPAEAADASVQAIIDAVRGSLEDKASRTFTEYTAISVARQVVAGTNHFVKIHVGNEEYVHVRIYQPLPGQGNLEVSSFQLKKSKEDEVTYF